MIGRRDSVVRTAFGLALLGASVTVGHRAGAGEPAIAYLQETAGYWQVWLMAADGSMPRQVSRSLRDKARLAWFPDGDRLLVSDNQGSVAILDSRDGSEMALDLGVAPVLDAVVSPSGESVAYSFSAAEAIDGNDIWVSGLDGRNRRLLVKMVGLQHEPVWTADGRGVYFLSGTGGQTHDIWYTAFDGSRVEPVVGGGLYHFDVAAGPQGALAYSSNRGGDYEIYLRVPGRPDDQQLTASPGLDGRPAFSADGQSLAFESDRGGRLGIWRLDLASREPRRLSAEDVSARQPVWQPGGAP
jgi:TolB protein